MFCLIYCMQNHAMFDRGSLITASDCKWIELCESKAWVDKCTIRRWLLIHVHDTTGVISHECSRKCARCSTVNINDVIMSAMRDGVSNHQPHDCLLNGLFRRRSTKTSKLRFTGLCERDSPVTGEFPSQRASNAENINISIWLRNQGDMSYHDPFHSNSFLLATCMLKLCAEI